MILPAAGDHRENLTHRCITVGTRENRHFVQLNILCDVLSETFRLFAVFAKIILQLCITVSNTLALCSNLYVITVHNLGNLFVRGEFCIQSLENGTHRLLANERQMRVPVSCTQVPWKVHMSVMHFHDICTHLGWQLCLCLSRSTDDWLTR